MTQAHLIISTEYHANEPSVFIFVAGNYYGCTIYPSTRNYPIDVDYWRSATCSDSDRYFNVTDVTLSAEGLAEIKKLQNVIDANVSMIKRNNWPYINKNWTVRRGKAYQEWKAATEKQSQEIRAELDLNRPFEVARNITFDRLRDLLLNLKK